LYIWKSTRAIPIISIVPATILVVDDAPEIRRLVRGVLEPQGFQVFEAGDGTEALQLMKYPELTIDLVITDLIMPRMNGATLADELERLRPGMPVLFISGYVESSLFSSRRPGVVLVNKPFTAEQLVTAVLRHVRRGGAETAVAASPLGS
jgi:two-component system cell cycle sensor histidine kinase/response regulator CckA